MKSDEPAWYYVGNGQLRLWDGRQWTESYRSADRPRSQAPGRPLTPVAAPAAERPGMPDETRRGSWLVTAALFVAMAVVAVVVGITLLRGDA